jgi:glycosyltransferase involved in cell wall biosynthesis
MVSVIAPCRNEAGFIGRAIQSILQGDYPADLIELLIVDGMSTDGTREIVQEMAKKDPRIRLLDNPRKIVPSAMNIGIKAACGEYIAWIGCHAVYAPNYISKCVELAKRTGADNVGGYWATLPGANTPVAKAIAVASSTKFGVGNSAKRVSGPERESDTAVAGTFKREVFEKVGLYDERFVRNQDMELNSRIRRTGGRIIVSPEIQVGYYNRATYRGLWQQSFNNGLWNPYTIWLVGRGLSLRHFVPMFLVLGLIILTIGTLFWWPFKWMLTGYILLYLSSAWFFAIKLAHHKKTSAFLILWSFIVLHIGYGLGSVWGVITIPFKFPNRHKRMIGKPLADRIA